MVRLGQSVVKQHCYLQLGYLLALPLNESLSQAEDFNRPGMQFMASHTFHYTVILNSQSVNHSVVCIRLPGSLP